jgi:hypothetical protein
VTNFTAHLAYDLTPNLAIKLNDNLALGIGADYRISTIDLTRNVPLVDPFSQQVVDVAQIHLYTDGASNDGWGWHAGFLANLSRPRSASLPSQSPSTTRLRRLPVGTGNIGLDQIVAQTIPSARPSTDHPDRVPGLLDRRPRVERRAGHDLRRVGPHGLVLPPGARSDLRRLPGFH